VRGPLHTIALTREGARLAARLAPGFPGLQAWAPARFAAEVPGVVGFDPPVRALITRLWPQAGGFLLVMAAGIAVRAIAALLQDKARDPAVVVLDPRGEYAVPLLSGHLGGANDLARAVAVWLGGTAVITTATDAAGAPAAELWARDHGLEIEDRAGVVRVNAAWANGEPVGLYVDPELGCPGLGEDLDRNLAWRGTDRAGAEAFAGALIAVTHRQAGPAGEALVLRPRCLHLGVGCRRDAEPRAVANGVRAALAAAGLAEAAVAQLVSVAAKADEPALCQLARVLGVPFRTFAAEELQGVQVPTPSARVAEAVGTPSVAEASALTASGGALILPKVKGPDWTAAVALGPPEGSEAKTLDGS
jgi:cobalt-precorrin 5A hydrolase